MNNFSANNDVDDVFQRYKTELDTKAWNLNQYLTGISEPLGWVLIAIGLLGNMLILAVLPRSRSKFSNSFRRLMFTTSVLDLLFLLAKIFVEAYRKFELQLVELFMPVIGSMYVLSLMGDCLALCLTAERFLAFIFPLKYQIVSEETKRKGWTMAAILSALVSLTRIHYSFANYSYKIPRFDGQQWLINLEFVSDTIVPSLMFVVCFFLATGMIYMTVRRYRDRNYPLGGAQTVDSNAGNNVSNATVAGSAVGPVVINRSMNQSTIISMVVAMFSSCFINQFGYVGYDIGEKIVTARSSVSSFGSFQQLDEYYEAVRLYIVFSHFSAHAESVTRGAGFYLYVAFNRTFRSLFLKLFSGKHDSNAVLPAS